MKVIKAHDYDAMSKEAAEIIYQAIKNIFSEIKKRHPIWDAFSITKIISRIRSPDRKCELYRLPGYLLLPVLR